MRYFVATLCLLSCLFGVGCAGKQVFTFQNAPGQVQIPGDWKDATTPGKSKATSPDGKAWVAMASVAKSALPSGDIKSMAENAWKAQNLGSATFEPAEVNGRPGAVGVISANGKITVVCVCEGKLTDRVLMVIATGEGVSERSLRAIATSYKE